jgi:endonuclease G
MRHALLIIVLAGCTQRHTGETDPAGDGPDAGTPQDAADPDPLHSVHLQLGVAADGSPVDDYLLVHAEFAESYNRYLNAPNWVSYRTTGSDFGPVERYEGDFYADTSLPADFVQLAHADMYGSGFDRGHMLRSEERTQTAERNFATFVMTNVLPQHADLNRGPWFDFELYVQRRVESASAPMDAYEIAGPVWPAECAHHVPRMVGDGCRDVGQGTDPAHHIAVPEATFKIVVFVPRGTALAATAEPEIVAVLMPNISGIKEVRWWTYRSNVEEIEQRTGYDFLAH